MSSDGRLKQVLLVCGLLTVSACSDRDAQDSELANLVANYDGEEMTGETLDRVAELCSEQRGNAETLYRCARVLRWNERSAASRACASRILSAACGQGQCDESEAEFFSVVQAAALMRLDLDESPEVLSRHLRESRELLRRAKEISHETIPQWVAANPDDDLVLRLSLDVYRIGYSLGEHEAAAQGLDDAFTSCRRLIDKHECGELWRGTQGLLGSDWRLLPILDKQERTFERWADVPIGRRQELAFDLVADQSFYKRSRADVVDALGEPDVERNSKLGYLVGPDPNPPPPVSLGAGGDYNLYLMIHFEGQQAKWMDVGTM